MMNAIRCAGLLLPFVCTCATTLLCLQTQAQVPPGNREGEVSITVHDDQINAVRNNLLHVEVTRKLNSANSIRRAYDATVTGWLDIGETMIDARRLADAKQKAEIKDAMLLPCLMVLSIDPNRVVARLAEDQAYRLSTISRPQSVEVELHLAIVKALQTLATDGNSAYRIASTLCLRNDYPYAECPSLPLDDWLRLCHHPSWTVRSLAIRQLRNYPERSQELIAMLKNLDDAYTKWDVCQTIAQLAPNRATIDWLRASILEGRSEAVEALVGLAVINPDARRVLGGLLSTAPSDFHLNSKIDAVQRDRVIVAIKSQLVDLLQTHRVIGETLANDLGELLLWRAGERVTLEHSQLRIATVMAMKDLGEVALPPLQRAAIAGVEESFIGLVRIDDKNRNSHINAISKILRSTDSEIMFDADRIIPFYKALGDQGPLAQSTRDFLLERFTQHDGVNVVAAIVEILQQSDLASAEAITGKLLERIDELAGVTGWGQLSAPQLIRMVGDGGAGALSSARLLKKAVESDNPAYVEAGAYSLIQLAIRCPEYRSSIAKVLQPALENENVANQLVLVLTRESPLMPEFCDTLCRKFHRTKMARLRLNIADACIAMGESGLAAELLAKAIDGGEFAGSNLAEAKELQADIEFASRASTSERIDRAVRHLVANVETKDALETLSALSDSANSELRLLEASLADLSVPDHTAQNALTLLKISPAHQPAQAAVARLLLVPDLSTQSELRLAGYAGELSAE